jgi:hypothetical protein
MPEVTRYNKVIDLLEQGKTVFASGLVGNGNLDDLTFIADSDYDMVMIEMEHEGLSFNNLRVSLQFLLNRKRIAEKGNLQPDVVPFVRIPPNSRERNQWIIKQALDTGVYGLVLPHLNTVDEAQAAVVAARYPQSQARQTLTRWARGVGGSVSLLGIGASVPKSITMQLTCGPWTPMGTFCSWVSLKNPRGSGTSGTFCVR